MSGCARGVWHSAGRRTRAGRVQVFFKQWRHQDEGARVRPVMVHINYHPNKEERMRSIVQYFAHGDGKQMMAWPGGSEPGT